MYSITQLVVLALARDPPPPPHWPSLLHQAASLIVDAPAPLLQCNAE